MSEDYLYVEYTVQMNSNIIFGDCALLVDINFNFLQHLDPADLFKKRYFEHQSTMVLSTIQLCIERLEFAHLPVSTKAFNKITLLLRDKHNR